MTAALGSGSFLHIEKLSKHFDEAKAVDQVTLDIQQGEIFALLGGSGCGKSTLLRMLAGFERPTSGAIYLAGEAIDELPPYERPINMMFQSYALFPHLTVAQNIAFGLERDGLPKSEVRARVQEMLALVQLKAFAQRKPHQLSGGQQQRVALARSLAKRPRLLLLDEPLGALDKKLREQTQIELVNILKKVGVTCVMVTHDQEEAMAMADRIAVMRDGRILQLGAPMDIYETPNSRFVAEFIGNVNLFSGPLVVDKPDHVVIESPQCKHYVSHGITGTFGMKVAVALRPEKICLSLTEPKLEERELPQEMGHNQVQGVITGLAYFGSFSTYHVRVDQEMTLKVTLSNAARHEERCLSVGDAIWAWWDGSDVVVLTQ
ncbi:polyamine ABC transporter ATP-binding protein [Limnohabitans sp.]|uniref:ABC transporter ATP-binding protein n=1 Tax=Limnohabitans sp. TaxID=1907725 RepID=UPI00286F342C|nr:polyamine ABC transporter ATP-binding protein [Limnohabitans sp.]